MTTTADQIAALDDKQAIHIANNLVQAAFQTSPTLRDLDAARQRDLANLGATEMAHRAGIAGSLAAGDELDTAAAGRVARETILALARSPGGEPIAERALAEWQDKQADFGVLSVPVAIALVWLVGAADIEFSIGNFRFHKPGLSGAQQVELAKAVLPAVVKQFAG